MYFNLFNPFHLEMERSDTKMLQLIELYEKRPYWYAACNWTVAAYATLSHDFVADSCEKNAGVTSVLVYNLTYFQCTNHVQ